MRQMHAISHAADWGDTQRGRVLTGMLAAVNADGYAGANVANVIRRAGVSRTSFYEYFTDKDDCFLALYQEISRPLLERIAQAVNASSAERSIHVVVDKLIDYAEAEPVQARFLFSDALAGGPRSLQERGRVFSQIAGTVHAVHASASTQAPAPDLPTEAVIGATQRLIAQGMRRGERNHRQLGRDLSEWLTHYERPIRKHHWSKLTLEPAAVPRHDLSQLGLRMPSPGRSGKATRRSSELRRSRILFAAAECAQERGYAASSLRAIMTRAGLRKATFYNHFADKHQAFMVLHELALQQSMAAGAVAYFSAAHWPERVWRCLSAVSQFHAAQPALAHVGLVESDAIGPSAIQRVEDSRRALATLLSADSGKAASPANPMVTEAIGAAVVEIACERIRHRGADDIARYAYPASYLALTPFVGHEAADRFVQRKLQGS